MSKARIYRSAKNAMQSGKANTRKWVLEFVARERRPDPLMGWSSAADTQNQVRLCFETQDQAVAYATAKGLDAEVELPHTPTLKIRAYADNFR